MSFEELESLRKENAKLKALLLANNIPFEDIVGAEKSNSNKEEKSFSVEEKLSIYKNLFRGRNDVFALRWENKAGKSGYSPACKNEWHKHLCGKPKIKCSLCDCRSYLPLDDEVLKEHLKGYKTVGIFPMLMDESCLFLAIDFDGESWQDDVKAVYKSCRELVLPTYVEISRSGDGAHLWIFFDYPVLARNARRLGTALISYTCHKERILSLKSYDRFFPNQDNMPEGSLGNLIALPLQAKPRKEGFSVFVDENLLPYADQWQFLANVEKVSAMMLENYIKKATIGQNVLDIYEENPDEPWKTKTTDNKLFGSTPEELDIVFANQIFIEKSKLPVALLNAIIRLACFQNPEFYKYQRLRKSVWDKPRIICCAENFEKFIALPRGCLDKLKHLCKQNKIKLNIENKTIKASKIEVEFLGQLHLEQEVVKSEILRKNIGVLSAVTAFGKTVVATSIIAARKVSTLVIVHRKELLVQWKSRISTFLKSDFEIGTYTNGKQKLSYKVDIATIQTLQKSKDLDEILAKYGQIIVDECHHISAVSFENVLKQVRSKYILGLTATPFRRDGHHPVIFMQCGGIVYRANTNETLQTPLRVIPKFFEIKELENLEDINDIFFTQLNNENRNKIIAQDILNLAVERRNIIVLSERKEHIELLYNLAKENLDNVFLLHCKIKKKERNKIMQELEDFPEYSPRIIFATGKLIGEGFDHALLDTLILASAISWKGTLQQYAGRLHRSHYLKKEIRIYDYIETNNPKLLRMWQKRLSTYNTMGYFIDGKQGDRTKLFC